MLSAILTHTPILYLVQSLWRDEAFSILSAQQSLSFIFTRLGFAPPFYYTLLHFWMKLFGTSEISARSLSVVGFVLATVLVIEWASTIYKKHWMSWFLPLTFFLNPMLLYYAFEVRTYAWYTFFAVATLYAYSTKKWRWFVAASVLGFYTHLYHLPFVAALGVHYLMTHRASLRHAWSFMKKDPAIKSFALIFLCMVPWLIKVALETGRLKTSWYFPVDLQLVKSVVGNMFIGYEGTPWYGWKYTRYLSLVLVALTGLALTDKAHRRQTSLYILFGYVPLITVIAVSFIKPLYVNRYLIPTTVALVFIVAAAIHAVRNKIIQYVLGAALLTGLLWFNWWYPPQHAKQQVRGAFEQINTLAKHNDVILATDPMIYLETLYYAKDRSRVYLYNPQNGVFPWYIGDALITPDRMVRSLPVYPMRAILVRPDASFEIAYQIPL